MARLKEQLANLLEYLGIQSGNYYHSAFDCAYDPADPLAYFLDQSGRAAYGGPFDDRGVPLYHRGEFCDYLPVHLCFYGLGHLDLFRATADPTHRDRFLAIADWLVRAQSERGIWLSTFPMPRFKLIEPHGSAMIQGLGISVLVRAFRLTDTKAYLDTAERAVPTMGEPLAAGGFACYEDGLLFLEEYPAEPCTHVLNGFIYALWGLHDLVRLNSLPSAEQLFGRGIETLTTALPRYDTGYWSLYHLSETLPNPAAVHYHRLHIGQLEGMYRCTGNETFREFADRWRQYLHTPGNALRTLPAKLRWLRATR